MIGYHYTSFENWKKIRKEGMKPYLMDHKSIPQQIPEGKYAIYVWKRRLRGLDAVGSILHQVGTKGTKRVVLLKLTYTRDDTKSMFGSSMDLYHTGSVGELKFHKYKTQARLLFHAIPAENIELVETYNIMDLLKYARRK